MIIRIAHRDHFTMIRNRTLRDSRLSFKARGLLAYLLSLPDDAAVNRDDLGKAGPDGVRAVRSALQELVTAGYLKREQHQGDDGRWVTETMVYEAPQKVRTAGAKRATAGAKSASAKRATTPNGVKDQGGGPRYQERGGPSSLDELLIGIRKTIPE